MELKFGPGYIRIWCDNCGTVTKFSAGRDEPDGKNVCQVCKHRV